MGKTPIYFPVDSFRPPLGDGVIHDVLVSDVLCCNITNFNFLVPSNIGIVSEILRIKASACPCLFYLGTMAMFKTPAAIELLVWSGVGG